MIKIVTDSTSDIPADVAKELGIEVVPIYILWEGNIYREGLDIQPDELFSKMATSNVMPTTSQPSQSDFIEHYNHLQSGIDGIVSIHISSKLSGTFNSASQASKSCGSAIPIEVIDSQLNTMGLGLVVMAAARLAKAGSSMKVVLEEAKLTMTKIKMLGVFDTLKYVIAGGRVNGTIGKITSMLNIKPLLTLRGGEVGLAGAARTYDKGMQQLADFIKKNSPYKELAVVHSAVPKAAEKLMALSGISLHDKNVYLSQLGASLGVHGGPGLLLVAIRTHD
jgi:DegV family protein with EDD domain